MELERPRLVSLGKKRDNKTTLDIVDRRALLITDESCHRTAERIINHFAIAIDEIVDIDVGLRTCSERAEVLPVHRVLPSTDGKRSAYVLIGLPNLLGNLNSEQQTKRHLARTPRHINGRRLCIVGIVEGIKAADGVRDGWVKHR